MSDKINPQTKVEVTVHIKASEVKAFDLLLDEFRGDKSRFHSEAEQLARSREQLEAHGITSLQKLLPLAYGNTGQCRVIARFLAGLYNGQDFPFDLTDLRLLDDKLFEDCMVVLRMDARLTRREVHQYFDRGSQKWEDFIGNWRMRESITD